MGAEDAADPQISEIRRLLYSRHGWAWTGVAGLIVTVIYAIIVFRLSADLTGFAAIVIFTIMLALTVFTLLAVGLALVDDARLRQVPPAALASAAAGVSHHPWHVHPFRFPPHHKSSWYVGCAFVAAALVSWLFVAPQQVNSLAFLAGAGGKTVFYPVDQSQRCAKGKCHTVTDGFLIPSGGGQTSVTWPDDVPLDHPFTVRAPVWAWGWGRNLVESDSDAIWALPGGLVVELFLMFAVIWVSSEIGKERRLRSRAAALRERPGSPDSPPWPDASRPEQATHTGGGPPWDQADGPPWDQ